MEAKTLKKTEYGNVPGEHSTLNLPESLIQKIWLKQDISSHNLRTSSGKLLKIEHPGRWNTLEGPDFVDASFTLNGERVIGDIEVHFQPGDWFAHDHDLNPDFNGTRLHVCLFPAKNPHPTPHNTHGYCPETVVLLHYLNQSIEEYALEEALLVMEGRDHLDFFQGFYALPASEQAHILRTKALERWRMKCAYVRKRLQTTSAGALAHQMALEVLGYRRNRAAMSQIAVAFPLEKMLESPPPVESLYSFQEGNWKLHKIRPANHPKKRLEQYLELVEKNPDWTEDWLDYAGLLPSSSGQEGTRGFRKAHELGSLYLDIQQNLFMGTVKSTRFNTLLIDALLPLAAVEGQKDLFGLFYHAQPGDISARVEDFLKHCPAQEGVPRCNGLNQGALQLFLELGLER